MTRAADDVSHIARRMREIAGETEPEGQVDLAKPGYHAVDEGGTTTYHLEGDQFMIVGGELPPEQREPQMQPGDLVFPPGVWVPYSYPAGGPGFSVRAKIVDGNLIDTEVVKDGWPVDTKTRGWVCTGGPNWRRTDEPGREGS